MAYVTEEYYLNVFHGEPVDPAGFQPISVRAEETVEEMTMYRLTPITFIAMPDAVKTRIKDAVCAQIEYLDANGGSDLDNGSNPQSAGLGKYNYTASSGSGGSTEQSIFAPRALRILMPTGLLYRGGGCR